MKEKVKKAITAHDRLHKVIELKAKRAAIMLEFSKMIENGEMYDWVTIINYGDKLKKVQQQLDKQQNILF